MTETSIGARIVAAREAAGMTRAELARRSGIVQEVLWRYERDKMKPGADRVIVIAKAIGCSTDDLLLGPPATVAPATHDASDSTDAPAAS